MTIGSSKVKVPKIKSQRQLCSLLERLLSSGQESFYHTFLSRNGSNLIKNPKLPEDSIDWKLKREVLTFSSHTTNLNYWWMPQSTPAFYLTPSTLEKHSWVTADASPPLILFGGSVTTGDSVHFISYMATLDSIYLATLQVSCRNSCCCIIPILLPFPPRNILLSVLQYICTFIVYY